MKFHGVVGFWIDDVETSPGVWSRKIEEKKYTGDIYRNTRKFQQQSNAQNDDLSVNMQISVLSDLYLRENFNSIRYVIWNDVKLSVRNVEIGYPRIVLDVGGVYNGEAQTGIT